MILTNGKELPVDSANCETKTEIAFLKSLAEKVYLKTDLRPFANHLGWRPGNMHLFIGVAGGGKSSLLFQIVFDLLRNNVEQFFEDDKTIVVYLSEEDNRTFKKNIVRMGMTGDKMQKALSRIKLVSEDTFRSINGTMTARPHEIANIIEQVCRDNNAGILLLDNLTTTDPYLEDRHSEISLLAKLLQQKCRSLLIPFLIFAHTKGDVNYPGFSMEDIRQKKTITMLSEFCYLIHRFSSSKMNSFLQVVKHRGYSTKEWFFEMFYNYDLGYVDKMVISDRDEFKEKLKIYRGGK